MLTNSGHSVDFVGSQTHGIRPETAADWYDWNCEAYPGWRIPDIAGRVEIALSTTNRPDVLLVHVGTNGSDWADKPGQVEAMLDMLNNYSVVNNHPMTVLLCLIINRFIEEDPAPTTQFNAAVAAMVAARSGDGIKVILVDMENGAGLDYTDRRPFPTAHPPYPGGDMWGRNYPGVAYDRYHPNDRGNTKMAEKFYEALVKELNPNDDFDEDGATNLEEYAADTNPNDMLSVLRLTSVTSLPDGLRVGWQGGVRATQILQRVSNLDTGLWMNISTSVPPTPIYGSLTDAPDLNLTWFYRINVAR